ncbi:MAG: leucine-rich repeat protein [Muribaculaceae bacterium]|nr:leucine-rich repeat protein [Muribaculaceae bacterium]
MRLNLSILTLALAASLSASAATFTVDGINYETTDGTNVRVIAATPAYTGDIVIPATFENNGTTYTVTEIYKKAFDGSEITSVSIPETVEKIGTYVFRNCKNLTTVNYNAANSTIAGGDSRYAIFQGCDNLTTLVLGDDVEKIPQNAFYGITSLTTLTIGESVKTIEKWSFDGCTNLTTIYYNAINCETIGTDGRDVFAPEDNDTHEVTTSVKNVIVGENVESIPAHAFYRCTALETLDLSKATSLETIGSSSFENCEALKAVDLSETEVTTINDHAFSGCRGMKTLDLGKTEKVGAFAFDWCRTLEALVLPESLTEIGEWGFGNLLGLNSTTIYGNPSDITIGASAFYNNQSILLNYSDEEMYPHSIEGCGGLMDSMDVVVNLKKIDGLLEAGTVSDPIATVYIRQTSLEGGIDPTIEFLSSDPDKARVVEDTEKMEGKSITKHEVKIQAVAQTTEPVTITMTIGDTNAEINSTVNIPIDVQVYGEKEGGEEGSTTGIDNLFVDENGNTVEVYTLQGVKVNNQDLTPGIYVRRVGDKATKVIVK